MPVPAIIAGLVMAAVLGSGLLALGAYTVHRYMNWRCRELIDLFQRNTVRVVKIEDLESQEKSRETRRNGKNRRHAGAMEQIPQHSQRQQDNDESQHMIGLRGGFDPENDPHWAQQRQIQPHVPMPAPVHSQPPTHQRLLGWHQLGTPYEQLWQPPPVFQQVPPQGGWYAYIPPRPQIAAAREPRPQREVVDEFEQERTQGGTVQQARRERRLDPAKASLIQALGEPVTMEGDSIEVVDGYPFVIEGVVHGKKRNKRKKSGRSKCDGRRQSSSTDLGTCSSSHSTSAEDIPREHVPEGHPRHLYVPPDSYNPYQENARHTGQAEGARNPYARQSHRSRSRRRQVQDRSVRRSAGWKSNIDAPRQAGTTTSPCPCLSPSTHYR